MFNLPKKIVASIITLYQKTLSPDHSWLRGRFPYGFCRFYPSCSEYTKQAVLKFGVIKGLYLGVLRILKCNPFVQPAVDQIPKTFIFKI